MRYKTLLIITLTLALLWGHNRTLFSWSLFTMFQEESENSWPKVMHENRDIEFLPLLKKKDFFSSVDDLSVMRRQDVRRFLYIYLTRARPYTLKAIHGSQRYYTIIKSVFAKHPDIPQELALLPLLESAFNPHAVSRSKAVGIWQFMANTAKPLGLKNNRWVDERQDIEKSTEAAIRHLRNQYKQFGSWELALAAYNGGGGCVKRAVARSGSRDIWSPALQQALPKETREYVPKYTALMLIFQNPRFFDIRQEIQKEQATATNTVRLPYATSLHTLARETGTSIKTIRLLNPELRNHYTPPYEKDYTLRLPLDACMRFEARKKEIYKHKIIGVKKYRIRKGDCLSRIASRFHKKSRLVMKFNQLTNPRHIRPGQVLFIPLLK